CARHHARAQQEWRECTSQRVFRAQCVRPQADAPEVPGLFATMRKVRRFKRAKWREEFTDRMSRAHESGNALRVTMFARCTFGERTACRARTTSRAKFSLGIPRALLEDFSRATFACSTRRP
ncbi:MAG: hypothetical protein ABL977_02960, partial [Candidatus Eisenbacteria bacterium]